MTLERQRVEGPAPVEAAAAGGTRAAPPSAVSVLLALQRHAGNQAVTRLLMRAPKQMPDGSFTDPAIGPGVRLKQVGGTTNGQILVLQVEATGRVFQYVIASRAYLTLQGEPIADPSTLAAAGDGGGGGGGAPPPDDDDGDGAVPGPDDDLDDEQSDDEGAEDVDVHSMQDYGGRRTKHRRAQERAGRAIPYRAEVHSPPQRFYGLPEVPVSQLDEAQVIELLKEAARSPHEALRRNALYLLEQPDLALLAGPHRGGLGGGGMGADRKLHITIGSGNTSYHLRISAGRPPADIGGSPATERAIEDRRIVLITPDAPSVAQNRPAAPAAPAAASPTGGDPLREYVERTYAAKLQQYRSNYQRPAEETYRLLLYNLRNHDGVIRNGLRANAPLNDEVLAAAEKMGLKLRPPRKKH